MNAQERKNKIDEIVKGHHFSQDGKGKRIRYNGDVKVFAEYEIPIDFIVYNVENGRIATLVKSYEREHGSLNPENPDDARIIAQFLYDSNDAANKKTKKNIAENGQLETGIITCDGVLVDGNRRVSLMRQITSDLTYSSGDRAKCEKFRAIVLPENADKKEILRLETSYQMGVDEKVGYNPIEKYLHAQDLVDHGFSTKDIAEYMDLESASKVTEYLEVMKLIDAYLEYFDYNGIYTRLPKGVEDDLLKLNTAIKKVKDGKISWIPTDKYAEIENDLKSISFDYIRLNAKSQDGFDFRAIASNSGANNFLANEDVWKAFKERWENCTLEVEEKSVSEYLTQATSSDESKRLLEARDNEWRNKVREGLMDNFSEAQTTIENKKQKEKPNALLKRAINAVQQIDLNSLSKTEKMDEIKQNVCELKRLCDNITDKLQ